MPGAIMIASDMVVPRRYVSGSLLIDASLGGGFAGNQWTEIYGPENHGKTAITLKALAANQALDPNFYTLWVASEHYDLDQAMALGVDTDRVQVLSTRDMPVAYDVILDYLNNRACDQVVLDSYPALIPPDEDSKDMDEYTQAEGAKMTNKFFRKVGKAGLRDYRDPQDRAWFGIFINQPRDSMKTYWTPTGRKTMEVTPGGRGKNFAFYSRLDVARAEWIEEGPSKSKVKVGQVIRTKTVKNKGGPPQRVASVDFYFTHSSQFRRGEYDLAKDAMTTAVLLGVLERAGSWVKFEGRQWQGLPSVLDSVREEVDLQEALVKRTREAIDNPQDKRTWDETDVETATQSKTVVRRRKKAE